MTTGYRDTPDTARRRIRARFAIAAAVTAFWALPATVPPALAAETALAAADQQCVGCHGIAGMEKKLANGDTLSLHVAADAFAKSVHGAISCAGCHADIDVAAHPPSRKSIRSARGYAIAANEACKGCHGEKFQQWQKSIHAALVRSGNAVAPVCTDCHSPHAVIKGAATALEQTPCRNCHADIYTAYLGSMHAQSRRASEQSPAPTCSGCHSAHDVKPTLHGEGPKAACSGCHANALDAHRKWLPNAALHFEVVSCPACHAPGAQRKVDLLLMDGQARAKGTEQIGVPLFEASTRSGGQGLDALALWNLLQALNRDGVAGKTVLRGRLEVRTAAQAHQLADKSKAVSECRTCHHAGSEAFQSVTISLAGPDGQRVRYGASADVLKSAISLDSVSGFYAIGGTRIKLLDYLLILAFLGGLAVPVGHMTLGWIFKRFYRNNGGGTPGSGNPPAGGGHSHST